MCYTTVHFCESESLRELPINSPEKKNVSGRSLRANYVRYVFSVVGGKEGRNGDERGAAGSREPCVSASTQSPTDDR